MNKPREERGASAVEYGLIVAAIAALITAIVFVLGSQVDTQYRNSCSELKTQFDGATSSC